ncbi:hypothetical protein P280DRAFT_511046 [Massarina eburnea CBS 473.64]|uniref:WSC domain-containing protein n=1 Tax=Massarina eburnea CBS 473.64 TaxID=1395130 RepID=A0A6A6RKE4_9PLEO|nr:hypothetical protein P280DRAFT_511046 [Massarina eburnea CBS 473.64]
MDQMRLIIGVVWVIVVRNNPAAFENAGFIQFMSVIACFHSSTTQICIPNTRAAQPRSLKLDTLQLGHILFSNTLYLLPSISNILDSLVANNPAHYSPTMKVFTSIWAWPLLGVFANALNTDSIVPRAPDPPAPATDLAEGWRYDGCYPDNDATKPVLGIYYDIDGIATSWAKLETLDENSASVCLDLCIASNYPYAGLKGDSCYCAAGLQNTAAPDETQCINACSGAGAEACGSADDDWVTVYTNDGTWEQPADASDFSTERWGYKDCYADDPAGTILTFSISGTDIDADVCTAHCTEELGDAAVFAGTGGENGQDCYCGEALPDDAETVPYCIIPCPGNENEACGGTNRISVYEREV